MLPPTFLEQKTVTEVEREVVSKVEAGLGREETSKTTNPSEPEDIEVCQSM
jgi:hypothetical protein